MTGDAVALTALIGAALAAAWKLDDVLDRRRSRRRCPVCGGADKRQAFRERGFVDWCEPHQDAWFDVTSIWD